MQGCGSVITWLQLADIRPPQQERTHSGSCRQLLSRLEQIGGLQGACKLHRTRSVQLDQHCRSFTLMCIHMQQHEAATAANKP